MYKLTNEQFSYLQIHAPGLTGRAILKAKNYFGTYKLMLKAGYGELRKAGLTDKQARKIYGYRSNRQLLKQVVNIQTSRGIRIVLYDDDNYPSLLQEMSDPPAALYVRGQIPVGSALSIVGTRKASQYGLTIAHDTAAIMAKLQIVIVSGLAYGIDSAAHRGAVSVGGQTVAVMGCGLDKIYPREHTKLAQEIIDNQGGIVSEFPILSPTRPANFIERNRIIAGLSTNLFVVEAGFRSGALVSFRYAKEYNREVWAVPGDITRENASGPNALLKDGVKMFLSVNDLVDQYGIILDEPVIPVDLDKDERQIVEALSRTGTHMDELVKALQLDIGSLSSKVIMLELKGVVRNEGAGVYRRLI